MSENGRNAARARLGGYGLAAKHDPQIYTLPAREAANARFLESVDPSGDLRQSNPVEAERRAEAARRLHFLRMAYRSAQARARNKKTANGSGSSAVSREVAGVISTDVPEAV